MWSTLKTLIFLAAILARAQIDDDVVDITTFEPQSSDYGCLIGECQWWDGMTLTDVTKCLARANGHNCQYHLQYTVNVRMDLSQVHCTSSGLTSGEDEYLTDIVEAEEDNFTDVIALEGYRWGTSFKIPSVLFLTDLLHWVPTAKHSFDIIGGTMQFALKRPVPKPCPISIEYTTYQCGSPLNTSTAIYDEIPFSEAEYFMDADKLDAERSYAVVYLRDVEACFSMNGISSVDLIDVVVDATLHTLKRSQTPAPAGSGDSELIEP